MHYHSQIPLAKDVQCCFYIIIVGVRDYLLGETLSGFNNEIYDMLIGKNKASKMCSLYIEFTKSGL